MYVCIYISSPAAKNYLFVLLLLIESPSQTRTLQSSAGTYLSWDMGKMDTMDIVIMVTVLGSSPSIA